MKTSALLLSGLLALTACSDSLPSDGGTTPPPGATSGDQTTTFDHDNDGISPWDLIDRLAKEGPPKYTSHVHSCPKVRVRTLGAVLTSLGVNVGNGAALSAGDLYNNGANAMGAANFANRIRENINTTTSGSSREFDIFAAASDEVIANIGTLERCKDASGNYAQLFDASDTCQPSGITCLIGAPASLAHLDYCNLTIQNASDHATGKRIAVAAMLAAAYTCE